MSNGVDFPGFYEGIIAISMTSEQDSYTITPSEPILANAVMMHLCGRAENWLISIDTLSGELLQQNPIEKGLKGELFSRVRLSTRSSRIPAFTVKDFLLALCASDNHKFVQKLADQILQAQMNFNYFCKHQ